jgi:hypothetical protein
MKKRVIPFVSVIFINLVSTNIFRDVEYQIKNLINNPESSLFVFQFLLFIIILALVQLSLTKSKLFEDKKIAAVVSLTVSLLSVYFLTKERIFDYILPYYGSLGLGLILILPLLIILLSIHRSEMNLVGRKAVLGIYSAFFAYFWYKNYLSTGNFWNEIYSITAGMLVLAYVFDKQLHEAMKKKIPKLS